MNKIINIIMLLLLATSVFAAESINGTVTDVSSNPIDNVNVSLIQTDGTMINQTMSDAAGYFEFNFDVSNGGYYLQYIAANYVDVNSTTVILDDHSYSISQTLMSENLPVGTLNGTVSYTNGTGIVGATLLIEGANTYSTLTDASGHYTINVSPDTYTITASKAGVQTLASAGTVNDNATTTVDFTLSAGITTGNVTGRVTDGTNPIQDAFVYLTLNGATVAIDTTDSQGYYLMQNIAQNSYNITASKTGYTTMDTTVTVNAGQESTRNFALGAFVCTEGDTRTFGSGVGACSLGTETCFANTWTITTDQIVASPEVCGDGIDNDCDGDTDEGCGGNAPRGGSSSSGLGSTSPLQYVTYWSVMYPNQNYVSNIDKMNISVTKITMTLKDVLKQVQLDLTKHLEKPSTVKKELKGAYEYFTINAPKITEDKVENIKIYYRVRRESYGLYNNPEVSMYRLVDGEWQKLVQTNMGGDSEYKYYYVETPGFSVFAIGIEEAKEVQQPVVQPVEEQEEQEETQVQEETEEQEAEEEEESGLEEITGAAIGEIKANPWIGAGIFFAIVLLGYGIYYLIRKNMDLSGEELDA